MAKLRDIRVKRVLSQADLAEKANLTTETICRLERGHRKPYFKTIRKLAKALKVKPEEIEF